MSKKKKKNKALYTVDVRAINLVTMEPFHQDSVFTALITDDDFAPEPSLESLHALLGTEERFLSPALSSEIMRKLSAHPIEGVDLAVGIDVQLDRI